VRLAPEPVPFGLAGPGGGPIAWDRIRLWFTNPAGGPVSSALAAEPVAADVSGLSSASADLREWSYAYPGLEPALPSDRVFDAASSGGQTLFATDAGLALYDGTARAWRRLSALTGGAAEVIAVEGAADGFWLGTRAGLVALRQPAAVAGSSADSSTAEETSDASDSLRSAGRWLAGRAVTALVADGRDLYAGTDLGLYRLSPRAPGSTDWTLSQVETVGRSVRDLALTPDVVVAATDRGVEILPRGPGEPVRFLTGESQLDDLPLAVAADAANVWIGTRAGVARWDRTRRLWTEYGLADGLPDLPVLHVLVQDERHVWFSTPGGVTRFDVGDPPRAR
jgi:ligand-binding sensor domain-containing protein